jgi:hypothetical protein
MKTAENVRVYVLIKGGYLERRRDSLFFVCIETTKRNVTSWARWTS